MSQLPADRFVLIQAFKGDFKDLVSMLHGGSQLGHEKLHLNCTGISDDISKKHFFSNSHVHHGHSFNGVIRPQVTIKTTMDIHLF